MFLLSLFVKYIASTKLTLEPGKNKTIEFQTTGFFIVVNPEDLVAYINNFELSIPIFGNETFHAINFTQPAELLLTNPFNVTKDIYYQAISFHGSSCNSYDIILNPSKGHYFQVGDTHTKSGNITLCSYQTYCLFYVGDATYELEAQNSIYNTALSINQAYISHSKVTYPTSFFVTYQTNRIKTLYGSARIEIINVTSATSDKTEMNLGQKDIFCYGGFDCSFTHLWELEEFYQISLNVFMVSIITISSMIIVFLILCGCYCCGCYKKIPCLNNCCCKSRQRTSTNSTNDQFTPQLPTNGPIYGEPSTTEGLLASQPNYYLPHEDPSIQHQSSSEASEHSEDGSSVYHPPEPEKNPYEA